MTTLVERFSARISQSPDGCWNWTGARKPVNGYGTVTHNKRTHLAHRLAYEVFRGPIPEGLELDHLCRNRLCCNPDHLEPVTRRENNRRSESPTAQNARKTVCHKGHPFDERNTYLTPAGLRNCRACRRDSSARLRARRSGVAA